MFICLHITLSVIWIYITMSFLPPPHKLKKIGKQMVQEEKYSLQNIPPCSFSPLTNTHHSSDDWNKPLWYYMSNTLYFLSIFYEHTKFFFPTWFFICLHKLVLTVQLMCSSIYKIVWLFYIEWNRSWFILLK